MREEKEDYFDDIPEDKPEREKKEKKPSYKPDDPRYYEQEETGWEHLTPAPRTRRKFYLYGIGILVIFCLLYFSYLYFFTARVQEAETYGYVEDMQRRGSLVTTYEGTILPYKTMMDTARVYDKDFVFSAKNSDVATELARNMRTGHPVRVTYKVYHVALPWRGESKTVVTSVDTVNPRVLLPPDRQPEHLP